MSYTTKCFIRSASPSIMRSLIRMGLKASPFATSAERFAKLTFAENGVFYCSDEIPSSDFIDCGSNVRLFYSLAPIRDDTDANQWFFNSDGLWFKCQGDDIADELLMGFEAEDCHKANVRQLINHFKT